MGEMKEFNLDFVRRTIHILEDYSGEYTFSNLINCSLGLIVLPYEKRGESVILDKNIAEIESLPPFTLCDFEPIKSIKNGKILYYPKTLKVLLQKIRNGLAHQNIKPINIDGVLHSIEITNKFRGNVDLVIKFTEAELRAFALFIADIYLNENNA